MCRVGDSLMCVSGVDNRTLHYIVYLHIHCFLVVHPVEMRDGLLVELQWMIS